MSELHMLRVDGDGCECGPTHLALMLGEGSLPELAREFAKRYGVEMMAAERFDAEGNYADDPEDNLPFDARLDLTGQREALGNTARAHLRAEGVLTDADPDWIRLGGCFVRWLVVVKGWEVIKPHRWVLPYDDDYLLPVKPERLREWDL